MQAIDEGVHDARQYGVMFPAYEPGTAEAEDYERGFDSEMERLQEDYHPATIDALKRLEEKRQSILEAEGRIREIEAAIAGLKFRRITLTLGYGVILSVGIDHVGQVAPLIRQLRQLGYRRKEREEMPESNKIFWAYRRGEDEEVSIYASLPYEEGAACRFVEDGVEARKKYRLVCEGRR